MHSMCISLQPHGIRVNLIAPGRIKVAHESKDGDEKGLEWAQLNEDKVSNCARQFDSVVRFSSRHD